MISMGDLVGSMNPLGGSTVGFPEPTGTAKLTDGSDTSQLVGNARGSAASAANVNSNTSQLHWSAGIVVVSLVLLWLLGGIVFKKGS